MPIKRTGTYVTFNANETTDPTASDIKYYNTLLMWDSNKNIDFSFINSHEKTSAVRDSSKKNTLENRLKQRLNVSKNMILIITELTILDDDWVPFEIEYGVDTCSLPIICAYPSYNYILDPQALRKLWPYKLADRIDSDLTKTIHVPFLKVPIIEALKYSVHNDLPNTICWFLRENYIKWGTVLMDPLLMNF